MTDETCSLCDEPAASAPIDVTNEETGEVKRGVFCEAHLDKLERYNDGEDVDFDVEWVAVCHEDGCRGIDGGPYSRPTYARSDKHAHEKWHEQRGEMANVEVERKTQ